MSLSIDPYALLDVTIESTPTEVRRAYYLMSLLCHPDKGGSADDMAVVHNAYLYVREQVAAVNRTVTVEDMEQAFAGFCLEQTEKPPPFRVLAADMEDVQGGSDGAMRAFNDVFDASLSDEACTHIPMSLAGGYGAFMDASSSAREPDPPSGPREAFETSVVVYDEPLPAKGCALPFAECIPTELDDYTLDRPVAMSDYRLAFTTTPERMPECTHDFALSHFFPVRQL